MLNEKQANVLTEEELKLKERAFSTGVMPTWEFDQIISSHRALNSRNAKLVHENDELMDENMKYKAAYDKCATGGNSLASVIIGWDLPKGWQDWTHTQANNFLYNLYGNSSMAYERYEIWLCWKSIREARQALEELNHE